MFSTNASEPRDMKMWIKYNKRQLSYVTVFHNRPCNIDLKIPSSDFGLKLPNRKNPEHRIQYSWYIEMFPQCFNPLSPCS